MLKLNFPLILIALILFLLSSCGGQQSSIGIPPVNEYETWKSTLPSTVEEFVARWGEIGKGWKFYWFDNLGPAGSLSLPYTEYKDISLPQIYSLKAANCHFITRLLQDIYGGEYLFLPHPVMSHAILLYRNARGNYCYCSFSGNFEVKEMGLSRDDAYDIIKKDFQVTAIELNYPKGSVKWSQQ